MDAFGFVYLVVGHDEIVDIARNGLMSRPVQLESDGEMLVDGLYFSTSAHGALRARNVPMPHLLRLNIDNVSEVTDIREIRSQDRSVDYVAGSPSPFTIPAFEIDFKTPKMMHWRPLERHRAPRAATTQRARPGHAPRFSPRENAAKIPA